MKVFGAGDVTRAVPVTPLSLSLVWFLIDTKSQVSAEISDSITAPSDETVNSDKVEIICDCFKQLHSHHGSPSIFPIIGPGLCSVFVMRCAVQFRIET